MAAAKKAEPKQATSKLSEQDRMALVRTLYGETCSICDEVLRGGQQLTLTDDDKPAHMRCTGAPSYW